MSADAIPTLLLGVIAGVGNVDRVQNVDRIAAVNLEQISRHDCRRTSYLGTMSHHDSCIVATGERATCADQDRAAEKNGSFKPDVIRMIHKLLLSTSMLVSHIIIVT